MKLPGYLEPLPPYRGELNDDGTAVSFRFRINRRHPSYWLLLIRYLPGEAVVVFRRWRRAARIARRMLGR